MKQCDIYVSASETNPGSTFPGAWTLVKADHIFAKATGSADYTGDQSVSLAGHSGRWVALRVDSSYDSTYVGIAEIQVFASNAPLIDMGEAEVSSPTQAALAGGLVYDGGLPTTVFAHWGTVNGGTDPAAWQATTNLGVHATGPLSVTVPTVADAGYFCRFSAVNDDGTNWSSTATFITAPVAVTSPGSVAESAGSVVFTLTRPASAADVDLALTFAVVGGTAAVGQDYLAPAGSVTLPAGSTNVNVSVTLLDDTDMESDKTMVVALTSGAFPPTAASTNTLLIVDNDGPIDPAAWSGHMDVALSGYAGATALTNFPFAVRLHEGLPGFAYADFGSPADGGDLCVTDPATELPLAYEIDTWNPSGTSVVWVSVPVLAGTNTKVRLHWGNTVRPPAPDTSQVVWAEGFGGVWHLGTPNPVDATWYANQGVGNANTTTNGVLGPAQHFNGTNAYVQVADAPSIGANVRDGLTVSLWMRSDYSFGTGEIQRMLEKGDSYFLLQRETAPLALLVKNGGTGFVAGSTTSVASNVWRHVCGTFDGATLRFYLDGDPVSSLPMAGLIDDDHLPLRIGSSDDGKYFTGVLDEVRIESVPRSADWIKASFDNQRLGTDFATFRHFIYVPPTVIVIE